jgi:preprotein translocase subunit SecG
VTTALTVLHVLACFVLIAVVLLQRGKGAEMGAVFGGGASSTVFGSRGAGNFLTKMTTACAVVFMVTSLSLSYIGTRSSGDRLFEEPVVEEGTESADEFEQLGTVVPEDTGSSAIPPADTSDIPAVETPEAVGTDEPAVVSPETANPAPGATGSPTE